MKKRFLFSVTILAVLFVATSCSKSTEPKKQVATPVFNPVGCTYTEGQQVTITCETEGAAIHYTIDGTNPTESSTEYATAIAVDSTMTIKAKGFKEGWNESEISMASYEITGTVATPVFDPPGGVYHSAREVTITCQTDGATIHYTIDGSDPDTTSILYEEPIQIIADTTLKARAYKRDWEPSEITVADYSFLVSTPTFNPPGGTYSLPQAVTITCETEGAEVRYTTDGSNPSESSLLYSNPITVSENTTLKARAYKENWTPSEMVVALYSFSDSEVEMVFVQGTAGVTFSPGGYGYFTPGGSYNVSLSDFYIGKYEVTQAEYLSVMGVNPGGSNSSIGDPLDHPINNVSWLNAIEYCNRLSLQEGLTPAYSYSTFGTDPDDWPPGWDTAWQNHANVSCNWSANGYRLPTEMEREYAARGGVPAQNAGTFNTTYAGTNVESELVDYAWYWENNSPYGTKPVGTKLPNELGLYDMSGKIWNRGWDIWSSSYPSGSYTDPTGPVSGFHRVIRGGSWYSHAGNCSVSYRGYSYPTSTNSDGGFRVCRVSP